MPHFDFPPPARQVYIHSILAKARATTLHSVVRQAASRVDPTRLRTEMAQHAPAAGLQLLQGTGVRDELIFVVPSILRAEPSTVGYYRLLLGASQKRFYTTATGLSIFKSMEERGVMTPRRTPRCRPSASK